MLVIVYSPIARPPRPHPHPRAIVCGTSVGARPSTAAVPTKVSSFGRHTDLQFGTYPHNLSSYEPSCRLLIGRDGRHLDNLCANAPPRSSADSILHKIFQERRRRGWNREKPDRGGRRKEEGGVVVKTRGGRSNTPIHSLNPVYTWACPPTVKSSAF